MEQFNLKDRFFNLLSLMKYVLESKTSVPFPRKENTNPFKKPKGYDIYSSDEDIKNYNNLEDVTKKEIEKRLKRYHYLRRKFEPLIQNLIKFASFIDRVPDEGQHILSFKLFKYISDILKRYENIDITYNKKGYVYTVPKNLAEMILNKPKKLTFIEKIKKFFNSFLNQRTVGYLYEVVFKSRNAEFSITAVVYSEDGKPELISFLKQGINDIKDGKDLFDRIETEIDSIVRYIPLEQMI